MIITGDHIQNYKIFTTLVRPARLYITLPTLYTFVFKAKQQSNKVTTNRMSFHTNKVYSFIVRVFLLI